MPPPLRAAARRGITYRPATEADVPFLGLVYASTRLEEVARTGWPLQMQRGFLQQQHEAQHSHYAIAYPDAERLVIVHGGEDVGRLYLCEFPTQVRIVDISLLPESRGRGIGEAILRDIGEDAATRRKLVSIHVEKENEARRLYLRLGFEPVEDKGVYDLMEWRPQSG